MFQKLFISVFLLFSVVLFADAKEPGIYYVTSDKLKVRTGPGTQYERVYSVYYDARVKVHEVKNGWARISYYNKKTSQAKWVSAKFLKKKVKKFKKSKVSNKKEPIKKISTQKVSTKIVPDNTTIDDLLLEYISKSDDYNKYKKTFDLVSRRLFAEKTCSLNEFKRLNGWIRLYRDKLYFVYCGGFSRENKIYLDVSTGVATK